VKQRAWPAEPADQVRLLGWALAIGLASGSAALLLRAAATWLPPLVWGGGENLVRAVAEAPFGWRVAIPVVGALLAGTVLAVGERWSGAARGWDILEAVVLRDGVLHLRPTLARAFSSLLTVASGGAVGREGPIVLLSATVASQLGQRLGSAGRRLRILTGCGVAAGLACAYNTPVGSALFTMEIIFGTFAIDVFAPLVFTAAVATLLTRTVFGDAPVFAVPSLAMANVWEIAPYTLLGLLGGLLASAFLLALRSSSALFRRARLPRPLAMAAAGLVLGLALLRYPELVGNGRESIADLFSHEWLWPRVLALLALRLLVTPLMVGSGAVGGVFTPTLFLGAMLGYAFGYAVHGVLPGHSATPAAYALVGMGALLAGTTHAPLTSVLMVFEMTLDYNLVVPLLVASAASSLLATRFSQDSVYTEALRRQTEAGTSEDPASAGALRVRAVMRQDQVTVSPDLPLDELLDRFVAARRNHLYVVDGEGRFAGAVNLHDLNRELRRGAPPRALRAVDLARQGFEATVPDERLDRVLERFAREECERLPVLADPRSRTLVGTVSKRDILAVYAQELLRTGARGGRLPVAGD
jgi:CIC family chloride channel protein